MNGPTGYNVRFTNRHRGGGNVQVTLAISPSDQKIAWTLARDLHLAGKAEVEIWRSGLQLGRCFNCGREEAWKALMQSDGNCGRCDQ